MYLRLAILALFGLLLAGCGVLPGSGPLAIAVTSQDISSLPEKEFLVIDVDSEVAKIAGRYHPRLFADRFGIPNGGKAQLIGVGDNLQINIWEAGDNGLFSNLQTKATQIQSVVDSQGLIFVPYAGRIRAAGRRVESVRRSIQANLVDKAIQPQVQVVVVGNRSNSAVVVGDVRTPGKFPISVAGTRVLDVVAGAGGSTFPSYETSITLKRGKRVGTTLLDDLFANSENNVFVKSGDSILLAHNPRSFSAFGAVMARKDYKFDARTVTLAEALAKAGGLNDNLADRKGVFLFRFEPWVMAKKLRPDVNFEENRLIPVVYRLNMNEARAFFLMRFFEVRDKDIIYVANSPIAEFGKFLQILGPLLSNVSTVNRLAK